MEPTPPLLLTTSTTTTTTTTPSTSFRLCVIRIMTHATFVSNERSILQVLASLRYAMEQQPPVPELPAELLLPPLPPLLPLLPPLAPAEPAATELPTAATESPTAELPITAAVESPITAAVESPITAAAESPPISPLGSPVTVQGSPRESASPVYDPFAADPLADARASTTRDSDVVGSRSSSSAMPHSAAASSSAGPSAAGGESHVLGSSSPSTMPLGALQGSSMSVATTSTPECDRWPHPSEVAAAGTTSAEASAGASTGVAKARSEQEKRAIQAGRSAANLNAEARVRKANRLAKAKHGQG